MKKILILLMVCFGAAAQDKLDPADIYGRYLFRDDIPITFGTDSDFSMVYDEAGDNRLEITDGTNLMLHLTDAGTTGNLVVTGTITATGGLFGDFTDLTVSDAATPTITLTDTTTPVTTTLSSDDAEGLLQTTTNHPLVLGVNSTDVMTIETFEAVGFGTSNADIAGFGTMTLTIQSAAINERAHLELIAPDLSGVGVAGVVNFINLDGGGVAVSQARIQGYRDGADDAMGLDFWTEASGGGVGSKMVLNSIGDLQIDGDHTVAGNDISDDTGVTITMGSQNVSILSGLLGVGAVSTGSQFYAYLNSGGLNQLTIEQDGAGDASALFLLSGVRAWQMGIDNSDGQTFKIGASASATWANTALEIDTGLNVAVPAGNLAISGSLTTAIATKTGAYTLTADDHTILANATSAAFPLTLPPASGLAGIEFDIKKIDTSGNSVTIDADGTETIDGSLTIVLSSPYDAVTLRCDGSNWFIF